MEEDFAVDNTTKLKAYTWCQEYLGGVWTQIDLEDFHIRDLRWVLCAHCTSSVCGHGAGETRVATMLAAVALLRGLCRIESIM